jgi:hypothetical protein
MTATLIDARAVRGRRITLHGYASLDHALHGIVTAVDNEHPVLRIRLDGHRSNIVVRADSPDLTYLDEVTEVPDLPMGRFLPTAENLRGSVYDGITVCDFDDDDLAVLTDNRDQAATAVSAHLRESWGVEDDEVIRDHVRDLTDRWAYFAWEPEDAEHAWQMHWCEPGDDMAVHIHYLPAL